MTLCFRRQNEIYQMAEDNNVARGVIMSLTAWLIWIVFWILLGYVVTKFIVDHYDNDKRRFT